MAACRVSALTTYAGGVKEFAVYTAARLGLFVVAYAAIIGIYLAVSDGGEVPVFWPLLLAVIVSAIASAVLLRAQRERFAQAVERRAQRMSARIEQSRSKEDEPDS